MGIFLGFFFMFLEEISWGNIFLVNKNLSFIVNLILEIFFYKE